ncbi:Uncharacterised protein [Mycobacteroides abscessus subsp. abscessus]|nr:Uncharacterised protein [Mycobacteroides abscessus subsp. abscessus]
MTVSRHAQAARSGAAAALNVSSTRSARVPDSRRE